ncbi:acyltransferase family protein [Aestuariivirga sp.]|uniref:acyltransferase family protein n=1 Tax=Aestuariivirga sp. TaxID=2650926 RepID=UPI0039E5A159
MQQWLPAREIRALRGRTGLRDGRIDTLRGIACILIVAFHVIGADSSSGLHVADNSLWRQIAVIVTPLRLPMFACLSGFLFHYEVSGWQAGGREALRKLIRLGIPLVMVSTLFYTAACHTPSRFCTGSPLSNLVLPYAHFWYLQASLIIFAVVIGVFAAANAAVIDPKRTAAVLFAASIGGAMILTSIEPNVFSVDGAILLLPFFMTGVVFHAFGILDLCDSHPVARYSCGGVLAAALVVIMAVRWNMPLERILGPELFRVLIFIGCSLVSCVAMLLLRQNVAWLAWIGGYSYAIYLFHPFFTGGSRMTLHWLFGAVPDGLRFPIGLAAGLALPILLHRAVVKHRIPALLLLGINRPPERRAAFSARAFPAE